MEDPSSERERDQERHESTLERLDRNTIELLNELRVAGTGVQVMFAFLLIVPFNNRFKSLSAFEHSVYFVTLLLVAIATVLLLAPAIHHRILFRHGEKRYLVSTANRFAIVGMVFIGLGFTGILVLLSDVVVGGVAPIVVGALAAAFIGGLWFGLPLARRAEE
jgi:hypothetical protein